MATDRTADWAQVLARVSASPMYRLFNLGVEEIGEGYARLRMPVGERYHQLYAVVHGGIAATLADSCIGVAMLTLVTAAEMAVTVEMKINYLAPLVQGELIGEGRIVHHGRTLSLGEADLRDQDGRLIAKATATYMVLPPAEQAAE